jgi:hypothetical protein
MQGILSRTLHEICLKGCSLIYLNFRTTRRKKYMHRISALFVLIAAFSVQSIGGDITSFAAAKTEAATLNKPLLIDFMTGW